MTYEIITDRLDVEKLAEDIFVSDDTYVTTIDYADLQRLKQTGTFSRAIIFNVNTLNGDSVDNLINAIKALQLPTHKLKAVLMNIITNDNALSSPTYSAIMNLRNFIMTIRNSKEDSENCVNNFINCLWTVSCRPSLPERTAQIHLMFTFEKTESDKLEDEKFEQLIREYHQLKRPIVNIAAE